MSMHLYFSLIPEALIASMLPPERFGQYYATGHKFKSKGQALFFEIDPSFRHEYFDIDGAFARCAAKADGTPKNSVYISMYRVMERAPRSASMPGRESCSMAQEPPAWCLQADRTAFPVRAGCGAGAPLIVPGLPSGRCQQRASAAAPARARAAQCRRSG